MNQQTLAQKLGVRAKTIREWENDLKEPRANRLQMLSALLGVTLRWLLTGEGDGVSPPVDEHFEPDPQLLKTLAELRTLRSEVLRMGERMGKLEKSLRLQISAGPTGTLTQPDQDLS